MLSESIGGVKVNRETRTVENVCLLGPQSKNGWRYGAVIEDPETPPMYEGRSCYLDHYDKKNGKKPSERSVRDYAGKYANVRKVEGKLRADIRAAKGPNGDALMDLCESESDDLGFSHVVEALTDDRTKEVKKLRKVWSGDFVSFPATTSIRESLEDVGLEELKGKLQGILQAGGKPAEVIKLLCETCEVQFDESKLDLPKVLSESELTEIENDRTELAKFRKEKLAIKAIADHGKNKVKATPEVVALLSEQADEVAMQKFVKVLAENAGTPAAAPRSGERTPEKMTTKTFAENLKGN